MKELSTELINEMTNRLKDTLHPLKIYLFGSHACDDADFPVRLACIKKDFTQSWLVNGGDEVRISRARRKHRERGIWQKRFWEHTIRDEDDLTRHVNYIHYNPVKHDLVKCPHQWPFSSFHRWAKEGYYTEDWLCDCKFQSPEPPTFEDIKDTVGE